MNGYDGLLFIDKHEIYCQIKQTLIFILLL